ALLLHRGGQVRHGLVRALDVDGEHEGEIAGGGGDGKRLADVHRGILEQVHAGGDGGAGEGIEHVPVGLGAGDELGRDIAVGADLVLDHYGAAGDRPQLFGEVAHENIRTAARRKSADQPDI